MGIPHNADFNGPTQEGAAIYQMTIKDGRRCSTAVGYLRPVLSRKNLTVVTNALVLRVRFEKKRAVGVEYIANKVKQTAYADREVIVSSGAIGSPKLMMLSGIGPAAHLAKHGIPVVQDLPGVGQNLQDHFGVDIVAQVSGNDSFNKYARLQWMIWAGLQYVMFKSGPVTSNVVEGAPSGIVTGRHPVPTCNFISWSVPVPRQVCSRFPKGPRA